MYILVEKIMNGTVQMQQTLTGYDMDFDIAVDKIKRELNNNFKSEKFEILWDDSLAFEFVINQNFPCRGKITAVPLQVIT